MANDGDLVQADNDGGGDGGGAPPAPADAKRAEANSLLFKALEGSGTSKAFRKELLQRGETIRKMLAEKDVSDEQQVSDRALNKLQLLVATAMFKADEVIDDKQQKISGRQKMSRAIKLVVARGRQKDADAKRESMEARKALRDELGNTIEAELAQALKDAATKDDEHIRYSNTRRRYLQLAQKLFAAGRFQKAFEQLENAKALKLVAKLEREASEVLDGDIRATANPRAADKVTQQLSHPLEHPTREILNRRNALIARAEDLSRLQALVNGDKYFLVSTFADMASKTLPAITADPSVFDRQGEDPAPAMPGEQDLAGWTKILDEAEATLDKNAEVGNAKVKAAYKEAKKALKALVHIEGATAARDDDNLDGVGLIALRKKAKDIPQELIRAIVAKIEAIEMVLEGGEMTADQYAIAMEFKDQALADLKTAKAARKDYGKIAARMEDVDAALEDEGFTYYTAEHERAKKAVEVVRQTLATEKPETLKDTTKELLSKVRDGLAIARGKQAQYRKARERLEHLRGMRVSAYGAILKRLSAIPTQGVDTKAAQARADELVSSLSDHGSIAQAFATAWSGIERGKPETYAPTLTAIEAADVALRREHDALDIAVANVAGDVADGKTSLDEWLIRNGTANGHGQHIDAALRDAAATSAEVREKEEIQAKFAETRKEMRTYIRNNKGGFTLDPRVNIRDRKKRGAVEKDMKKAFENYGYMLDALKARAEAATSLDEWRQIQTEMDETREKIIRFAEDHRPPSERVKAKPTTEQGVLVIEKAVRDIKRFGKDLDAMLQKLRGPEKDAAAALLKTEPQNADALALQDMLTNKDAALTSFAQGLKSTLDTALLTSAAQGIRDAKTDDERMAIRERALAQLRRKRLFFAEAKLGLIYRANPIDGGVPGDVLVQALAQAESKVLALIKRGSSS